MIFLRKSSFHKEKFLKILKKFSAAWESQADSWNKRGGLITTRQGNNGII